MMNEIIDQKVLADIASERESQFKSWGEQNHNDAVWALIAGEEFGEVQQAILHDQFGGKAAGTARDELVQLAAVSIAWIECIDRHAPNGRAARPELDEAERLRVMAKNEVTT